MEPLVREMDEKSEMPASLLKKVFNNGVRNKPSRFLETTYVFFSNDYFQFFGVEIPHDFGGAESSFFSANIVIEELAKVGI